MQKASHNDSTTSARSRRAQKRARDEEVHSERWLMAVTEGSDMLKRRIQESGLSVSQITWAAMEHLGIVNKLLEIPFTQRSLTQMWLKRHQSPYDALYQLLSAKPFQEDLLIAMDLARMCGSRHHTSAMHFGGVKVDKPTPLLIALLSNRADLAEMILKDSAFLNGSIDNSFALHWCVIVNNLDGIRLLASHRADLNFRDDEGESPMHIAATNGQTDAVELLLNLGAAPDKLNRENKTPWCLACEGGHIDVGLLLKSKGADPEIMDEDGHCLLAGAADDLNTMRIMLQCGANPNARVVRNGSALCRAIMKHNVEAVLMLLDWGADVNIDAPLCLASCKNDSDDDSDGSEYDLDNDSDVYEDASEDEDEDQLEDSDEEHIDDNIPSNPFL